MQLQIKLAQKRANGVVDKNDDNGRKRKSKSKKAKNNLLQDSGDRLDTNFCGTSRLRREKTAEGSTGRDVRVEQSKEKVKAAKLGS